MTATAAALAAAAEAATRPAPQPLRGCARLHSLLLGGNRFGPSTIPFLGPLIGYAGAGNDTVCKLVRLDLRDNRLLGGGMLSLALALDPPAVSEGKPAGAAAQTESLSAQRSLSAGGAMASALEMATRGAARHAAAHRRRSHPLRVLCLRGCNATGRDDYGSAAGGRARVSHESGKPVVATPGVLRVMEALLASCPRLRSLDLSRNGLVAEDAVVVAGLLRQSVRLSVLDVSANSLGCRYVAVERAHGSAGKWDWQLTPGGPEAIAGAVTARTELMLAAALEAARKAALHAEVMLRHHEGGAAAAAVAAARAADAAAEAVAVEQAQAGSATGRSVARSLAPACNSDSSGASVSDSSSEDDSEDNADEGGGGGDGAAGGGVSFKFKHPYMEHRAPPKFKHATNLPPAYIRELDVRDNGIFDGHGQGGRGLRRAVLAAAPHLRRLCAIGAAGAGEVGDDGHGNGAPGAPAGSADPFSTCLGLCGPKYSPVFADGGDGGSPEMDLIHHGEGACFCKECEAAYVAYHELKGGGGGGGGGSAGAAAPAPAPAPECVHNAHWGVQHRPRHTSIATLTRLDLCGAPLSGCEVTLVALAVRGLSPQLRVLDVRSTGYGASANRALQEFPAGAAPAVVSAAALALAGGAAATGRRKRAGARRRRSRRKRMPAGSLSSWTRSATGTRPPRWCCSPRRRQYRPRRPPLKQAALVAVPPPPPRSAR